MFDLFFKEFELENMKNDHMFESATDMFGIQALELNILNEQGFFEGAEDDVYVEAAEKFMKSVRDFFKNLIENIKKLAESVRVSIETYMTKKEINKKMEGIKKQMAINKAMYVSKKVKYFDTARFMKAYTKYVNEWISSYKKLYNKEYKSVKDYEEAVIETNRKLDKLYRDLNLHDDEVFTIDSSLLNLYENTEAELKNMDKINKMYQEAWEAAIKEMFARAEKEDDQSKIQDIKSETTKFSTKCTNAFKKIAKSPITKVGLLLAGVGAIGLVAQNASSK